MKKINHKRSTFKRRKKSPIVPGETIDYKNVGLLRRFVSEQGKILSKRITRLTSKQQRSTTRAIKSARILATLHFLNNEN